MRDRRGKLIEQTASTFADLARRSIGVDAARMASGELAGLDRHPLRTEPASSPRRPGVRSGDAGLEQMRALFDSTEDVSVRLLEIALNELVPVRIDPEFEQAVWAEVRTSLVARRPGAVAGCLYFLILAFQMDRERIPTSIDPDVSVALDLIRAETAPGRRCAAARKRRSFRADA